MLWRRWELRARRLLFEPHFPVRTPYAALSKTAAPALSRSISIISLTAFLRPRRPAWDWACPFRAPSSKRMVDTFEPTMNRPMAALVSTSSCRRSWTRARSARIELNGTQSLNGCCEKIERGSAECKHVRQSVGTAGFQRDGALARADDGNTAMTGRIAIAVSGRPGRAGLR